MSAISGMLSIGAAGYSTNEWVSEYQESILVRNAKGLNVGTTLFGLMSQLKSEPSETVEYKWFERDPVTRIVYAQAAVASAVTGTITFDDNASPPKTVYGIVQPGVTLRNIRTGEVVLVTSVTPTSSALCTATVDRGFDGAAANIDDNDAWTVLTLAKDEGADPALAVFETAETKTNYIQTFNSTVFLANAFKGSKLRTDIEGPLTERRTQALERIARDIELAYLFGKAAAKTGTNGNIYFTGGIRAAVDATVTVTGGANALNGNGSSGTSLANVNAWFQSFMTLGSDAKLFLCGPQTYATFSTYANSGTNGYRITGTETVFGMNITTVNTPFGTIDLAMHPLFKEIDDYNDWGVVVDLAMIVQKVMEPLFLEPNIQTPGQDSYKEQFRAKYGLKLKFAEAFGYCYDFQKIT